jgi:hypothetical protein
MNYKEWVDQRNHWFQQYPVQPPEKHLRLDIELTHPRRLMSEVPVSFNPHLPPYDAYECFYICDDWSIIFDICNIDTPHEEPVLRMLVESGHQEPWGERIRLLSTAGTIFHESWAARKNWNDFAFFRGQYWKITYNENFGDWPGGRVRGLPFQDRRHYNDNFPSLNDWGWS